MKVSSPINCFGQRKLFLAKTIIIYVNKTFDNKIISYQKWVEINAISFLPVDDVLNISSVEITKSLHTQRAREDW